MWWQPNLNFDSRTIKFSVLTFCTFNLTFTLYTCNSSFAEPPAKQDGVKGIARDKKMLEASAKAQKSGPIELEGEVVDAWCWSSGVMGPGRGAEHKKCAMRCILGGVSAGIVDDADNLYIAAKSQAYTGCKEQLSPYIEHRVKIKGWIAERGGCKILKISKVEDLGPAENFKKKK